YALGETRTPAMASVGSVGVKIGASFLLIHLFRRVGIDAFLGLALATSLAAWINLGSLGLGLRRRLGRMRGLGIVPTYLKMLVLSAVMGWGCALFHGGLERWLGGGGLAGAATRLGATIALGIGLHAAGLLLLDLPEGRSLFSLWRRR
ncbi:MAG: polysaccharide biosynthesis C-terminal domain-containing protein, partial [Deltaproteobacteria bacterium]